MRCNGAMRFLFSLFLPENFTLANGDLVRTNCTWVRRKPLRQSFRRLPRKPLTQMFQKGRILTRSAVEVAHVLALNRELKSITFNCAMLFFVSKYWSAGDLISLIALSGNVIVFREFLKTEYSHENLDFWLAVEEYKNLTNEKEIGERAQYIFDTYIRQGAPDQVKDTALATEISKLVKLVWNSYVTVNLLLSCFSCLKCFSPAKASFHLDSKFCLVIKPIGVKLQHRRSQEPTGSCPPNFWNLWSFCALTGGIPNKIVLFA